MTSDSTKTDMDGDSQMTARVEPMQSAMDGIMVYVVFYQFVFSVPAKSPAEIVPVVGRVLIESEPCVVVAEATTGFLFFVV